MEEIAFRVFDRIRALETEKLNENEDEDEDEEEAEYEDSLKSLRLTITKQLKLIAIRRRKKKEKKGGGGGDGNGKEDYAPTDTGSAISLPVMRMAISLNGTRILLRDDKVSDQCSASNQRLTDWAINLCRRVSRRFGTDAFKWHLAYLGFYLFIIAGIFNYWPAGQIWPLVYGPPPFLFSMLLSPG